ncbi:MAG: VWA domain-containing protein [Rhodobacteraceae bacterium]|nr:VWA domain-containing protein [Paracoccaceae bacterium]
MTLAVVLLDKTAVEWRAEAGLATLVGLAHFAVLGCVLAALDDRSHLSAPELAALLLATARPTAKVTLPWARTTLMLALDASLSMRVADVEPTRMVAAQQAAKAFLLALPKNIDVGIVTFAANAPGGAAGDCAGHHQRN